MRVQKLNQLAERVYARKARGGSGDRGPHILNLECSQLQVSGRFIFGTSWIGGWVGRRNGPDVLEEIKIRLPLKFSLL